MNGAQYVENLVTEKLLSLHTCYIGVVLKVIEKDPIKRKPYKEENEKEDETEDTDIMKDVKDIYVKIQPLLMSKQYGKDAIKSSVLPNVPVAWGARYKLDHRTMAIREIKKNDLVVCVCGERDITEARRGNLAKPVVGQHHDMSDSIVIALL